MLDAWIVFEDRDVVAIAKPVGVPCEAPADGLGEDLPTRLARFFEQRDGAGGSSYLGAHQRLDAATSGVVLYARRREANAGLARQFEAGEVIREYVAAVVGWRGGPRVLRHHLAKGDGARLISVAGRDARGKAAEAHIRVLAREGERALLLCRVTAGGPLTLRTQLALEHAPVVGDTLYASISDSTRNASISESTRNASISESTRNTRNADDTRDAPISGETFAAPRLLLHARRLALRHPLSGAALDLVAEPPRAFDDWLRRGERPPFDDTAVLRDRLADAREARFGLAQLAGSADATTAYRLVNEHGDGMPGLAVDVYGEHCVAQLLGEAASAHADAIFDALAALGFAGVYAKYRPRQANVLVDTRRDAIAPKLPVRGVATPAEALVIYEHGLPLEVRLGDGLSTGLFLDQRETRRRVRELAGDARVLNLFAYTCAFTAAAAAGGARATVSIDAARDALAWGERNVARARAAAGTSGDDRFVRADVFDALTRLAKSPERFELVIVDPPTYATTRTSRWTSGASWRALTAQCVAVLAPGGRLIASSNDRRLPPAKFRRFVQEGVREAARTPSQVKEFAIARDFPPGVGRDAHLKSLLVTLR